MALVPEELAFLQPSAEEMAMIRPDLSPSVTVGIDLRTLDIADRTWVTGFDLTWQGKLTQSQQQALEQRQADPWFRGARTAPYDPEQSDLLAANLARDLAHASPHWREEGRR